MTNYKILVVDDDPVDKKLVESLLTPRGYKVETASDGLEALVKIKKDRPDLVILDVMMPEVNGYDVCYQLRFNKEFEKIPIILLTSREQELNALIGEKTNIDYMSKPVNAMVLFSKIDKFITPQKEHDK